MANWFACKVKYQKSDDKLNEKLVSELYLVDAVSFTDAEARIIKEMEPYISGEFSVTNIKLANYAELVNHLNGDRWFKCKLSLITIDEKKGVERKTNTYLLVLANNVKEAYEEIERIMSTGVSDYEIPSITESPILDVFAYDFETQKERNVQNKTIDSNLDEDEYPIDDDQKMED